MNEEIELLRKLGFSEDYIKVISEINTKKENDSNIEFPDNTVFEAISTESSEITYPIIEESEKPIASFVN